VVHLLTQPRSTTQAEEINQGSAGNGFILVTGKHRNFSAVNKVTNQVPVAFMFGARNATMLPVIAKKAKHVFICVTL
jgi:hypothetical protein